ncbi:MAG: hypothetical protein L6R45_10310 [Anaerolineae bacterium]|nr:hypothetical protein [Anaerolineae bacterium]
MIFTMPYIPEASVNHSHTRHKYTGQPIKKPVTKKWQMVLVQMVRTWTDEQRITLPPGGHVVIWLTAEFPLQPGTRPNADNFLKIAQDAIAEGLGTDDDIYPFRARVKSEVYNQPPHQGNLHYEVLINAQDI